MVTSQNLKSTNFLTPLFINPEHKIESFHSYHFFMKMQLLSNNLSKKIRFGWGKTNEKYKHLENTSYNTD